MQVKEFNTENRLYWSPIKLVQILIITGQDGGRRKRVSLTSRKVTKIHIASLSQK